MRRAVATLVLLAAGCGGCSGALLGPDGDPDTLYRLEAPTAQRPATSRLPLALAVAPPRAAESLDSDRVAVVQPGSRFDHFAGIRWSEPAPVMLQSLLVGALQASGRFETVAAAPTRIPTDLLLDAELRHFEARYAQDGAPPAIRVEVQLTLVDTRTARRLSGLLASAEVAAGADRRAEVMDAFERATAEVLQEASEWLVALEPPASVAAP